MIIICAGRYDSVELMLKWEETQPVILQGGVNLTEFRLVTWETSSTFKYQYSSTDFKSAFHLSFTDYFRRCKYSSVYNRMIALQNSFGDEGYCTVAVEEFIQVLMGDCLLLEIGRERVF